MNTEFELWQNSNGKSYAREFILDQGSDRAAEIEAHLLALQGHTFMELLRAGNIKKIKGIIYEIRMRIKKTEYRFLFVEKEERYWIVEGFIKKTMKTPIKHITTAEYRIKELL